MKDLLELLGADVVGPAATTAEAERLLSEHAPDVALVDFHLRGGELSYSLIARLHEQGVPVIMISGSSKSPSGLPVEAATILEKPVSEAQLLASLRPLLKRSRPGEVFCPPSVGLTLEVPSLVSQQSRCSAVRGCLPAGALWPLSIAQLLIWVQNSICGIQRHTIYRPPRD